MLIAYCTRCLLPSTKPDLLLDIEGVCSAHTSYDTRPQIDWQARGREFDEIVAKYSGQGEWDCIVPVSGGKDSTWQVLKLLELGLRPLCVNSTTCDESEIGRRNLRNIRELGVDSVAYSPNPVVRKKLNKLGLGLIGDIAWPEHVGIFTIPVRAAVQFNVPLIVWGENSQNEYGGPAASQESPVLNRERLEEFGGLIGLRVSDVPNLIPELDLRDLSLYTYPSDSELQRVGCHGSISWALFPMGWIV
jgi:hypothetical protein